MTSRQRVRQIYYSNEGPSNKKYLAIGVFAVVIIIVLFFTLTGESPPPRETTTTTSDTDGGIDLNAEISNIRAKLNRVINTIDGIEQSQSSSPSLAAQVDDIIVGVE